MGCGTNVLFLIGKDVHMELNKCTIPATSTCKLGKEDDRSVHRLVNTTGNLTRFAS